MNSKNQCKQREEFLSKDIINLFEKQVIANPKAIAAAYKDSKVSYGKLNERSNQVAYNLIDIGVVPEEIVAVMGNRSIDFLTCILGIFKAAGAYMPINPTFPDNRIFQMLEQSRVTKIIVEKELYARLRNIIDTMSITYNIDIFIYDDLFKGDYGCENPSVPIEENYLAYVIFTSGSTGKPKGAMLERIGMAEHIYAKIKDMNIECKDRVAQIASQCFDISIWQFLSAICVGGEVHIFEDEIVRDPHSLLKKVNEENITIMQFVPSMLRTIVNYVEMNKEDVDLLKTLRWMALVGEALPPELCRKWFALYDIPLLNSYGPTECSDGVSHYLIYDAPEENVINMSIGKEIQNLKAYVLEPGTFNEVGFGEEGELCVAGTGVGRGYIHDEERTSKVFFKNPFTDDESYIRLYRTGDLVKYQDDGNLEYLGRIDRQVKIRGFRIELPEIEYYIMKYDGIKACAVVPKKRNQKKEKLVARDCLVKNSEDIDDIRLIAYIIGDRNIKQYSIKQYLGKYIPAYMIPDTFIKVDEFPLNSNGKLDVKALPDIDGLRPDMEVDYVKPENSYEIAIANIWEEVLGINKVGKLDNFIQLGGDSLLAMRTLNRMEEELNVKLKFDSLFLMNVEELANMIQKNRCNKSIVEIKESENGRYPLSLEQQRLWFLWKLERHNPFYMLQGLVNIEGNVSMEEIKRAWVNVIMKHDGLRARFVEDQEGVYQRFDAITDISMPMVDISGMDEKEQTSYIKQSALEEIQKPFDIENEPLYRFKAFYITDNKYQVVFTTHEIVMDAWSLSVIMRQIRNECQKLPTCESEEVVNLRHYVLWEKEHITKGNLKKQADYWSQNLSGKLPVLNMPKDHDRNVELSYKGSSEGLLLQPGLSNKLRQFSRENGTTLFMTLLSAYAYMLCKYMNETEVIIGSPHVNRNVIGTENLVGFFLNMLPFRIHLDENVSYTDYLSNVKEIVVNGFSNSNYPFMWMVENADTIRDGSNSPVFQTMFNMYSEKAESLGESAEEGTNITFRELETGYTKYELTLYAQEHGESIYLQFSYFKDWYHKNTIDKMLGNLVCILESIVENTHKNLGEIDYISKKELKFLKDDCNKTSENYDYSKTIIELFEDQVCKTPDHIAYYFNDNTITYRELNSKANQLACYLREKGVGSGTYVAIGIPRSFQMLIAMFAVLKLGAVYIPLDTNYPINRLQNIIDDTNAKYLIITDKWDDLKDYDAYKINIDEIGEELEGKSNENLLLRYDVNDTFNIIYTSSSTGNAKGVKISGRAVLNRLHWMWNEYPFLHTDVAVFHKSYALVAATWECFGALLKGLPTLMLNREDTLDPTMLWDKMVKYNVSYFLSTPAMLQGILGQAEMKNGEWKSLRLATTSAEPISDKMVEKWHQLFENVPLLNLYGATECASNALVYDTRELKPEYSRVPVGKPLSNTRIYITDEHMKLVPFGAVGELCVSGDCVAQGYVNEELTREKFVQSELDKGIVYKTGDLARYMSDGSIELVGRKDYQVKIRGFRVELGDIELTLLRNKKISKCAVKCFDSDNGKYLVAYIVAKEQVKQSEIRKYLCDHLPDYMIPTVYIFTDNLPLTTTGKIDRKQLMQPDISEMITDNQYVEPKTEMQQYLAGLWSMLLRRKNIGINDNFFELGGHSLIAVQMSARIYQKFELSIPIRSILSNPTIEGLSNVLEEEVKLHGIDISKVSNQKKAKQPVYGEVPLSSGQAWYFNIMDKRINPHQFNVDKIYEIPSHMDANKLKEAVSYLWKEHDNFRARFYRKEGKWIQYIEKYDEGSVPFYHIHCEDVPKEEQLEFIEKYASKVQTGFDINSGTLLNVSYLDFGKDRTGRLLIIAHHLVCDGGSYAIFVNDLEFSYQQIIEKGTIELVESMISIKEYMEELHKYAHSDGLASEIEYWMGLPWDKVNHIPLDYPENISINTVDSVENIVTYLTVEETDILSKQAVLVFNTDLEGLILWAVTKTLSKWIDSDYVEITSVRNGDTLVPYLNHIDITRTLGWKSTGVPLVLKDNKFDNLIDDVKSIVEQLNKVPNGGYGFHIIEDMLDDVEISKKLCALRKDEINFNFRGALNNRDSHALFQLTKENIGEGRNGKNSRFTNVIELSGAIVDGRLQLIWHYSRNVSNRDNIEAQSKYCLNSLKKLVECVQNYDMAGFGGMLNE